MIEIEAKFKLSTEVSREQLIDKLAPKFSAPLAEKHQIDTVFLLPEQVNAPIVPGSKIMRVRDVLDPKSGELTKSLLTLKVERETKLASDEYEFAVENGARARQMLAAMGWQEVVTVMTEDGADTAKIQAEMKEFLRELGLKGEIWTTPYDTGVRNLQS